MKSVFLLLLFSLSFSVFATRTPEEARKLLERTEAARVKTIWSCGGGNVEMFDLRSDASGILSSGRAFVVRHPVICDTLRVVCPFVSGVENGTFGITNVLHQYWPTQGKYEDTLMFISDNRGMKLVKVGNGSRPWVDWDRNWYFNPGECVLN